MQSVVNKQEEGVAGHISREFTFEKMMSARKEFI